MSNIEEEENFFVTRRARVQLPDSLRKYEKKFAGMYMDDTLLEKKHAELEEVQHQLERRREEFKKKEEGWMEREEILKRKKLEFISYINEKEEITRQTVRKIEKFKMKLEDEKDENIAKQKQIADLERKIVEHKQIRIDKKVELQKMLPYENYLKQVLREEPTFQNMIQILKRYDTLSAALTDLEKELESNNTSLVTLNKDLKVYRKRSQNRIYELNHQIRKAQSRLEKKKSDIKMAEQTHMTRETNLISATQLLSRVNLSITELYRECLKTDWLHKSSQISKIQTKNRNVQLSLVKRRMSILLEMYVKMKEQQIRIRQMNRKKKAKKAIQDNVVGKNKDSNISKKKKRKKKKRRRTKTQNTNTTSSSPSKDPYQSKSRESEI